MKKDSIDLWFTHILNDKDLSNEIRNKLYGEPPLFISWVGERICNLQCQHCIFQEEKSYGTNHASSEILLNLVSQISSFHRPIVIHEGRILRKWHLPILGKLQQRSALVGLIDNGTYVHHIDSFERKLDWMDISIDGTQEVHNLQRNNDNAYQVALNGIKQARQVANKVTSLFTVTSTNYSNVYEAAAAVVEHLDEFHIIPVSPVRPEIMGTETTQEQMVLAWKQVQKLVADYPGKIFIRAYQHQDLVKIGLINPAEFAESLKNPIGVSQGRIVFRFQGVDISYLPKSLSINETIVVDVDDWYRLPYSISYTIPELASGRDKFGRDISAFSLEKLDKDTDFESLYLHAVGKWWKNFGHSSLVSEQKAFSYFFKQLN